jgi:hypothetical protein
MMANLQPGDLVILLSVPSNVINGLPKDDQMAIRSVIGKTVKFSGISFDQAEIEFRDGYGDTHTIWVDPDRIRPVEKA